MTMIKGITVTLYEKEKINEDAFGKPIYKETPIKVKNEHVWEDNKVEFFGETWKVIGLPQQGIEHNIPLEWNQKWMVERYG